MLFSKPLPLGLYIHIPWCIQKCPYCDFNSHAINGSLPEREYIDALLSDLEQEYSQIENRSIETIFIGGGTPSLFSPESIDRLLTGVKNYIAIDEEAEITLEANPGALETGKFSEFSDVGINRVSIGVQSFQNSALERLGRIHQAKDAFHAAEQAHAAGLENFNLDLMFGLPGQTPAHALKDLQNAVSLEPAHISWYQLTLEPNTAFYHTPPINMPTDETCWEIQQQGQEFLAEHSYNQYEISAYARKQPCKHNLNYWQFGDYIGIGAGAHAKITLCQNERITRTAKIKHPNDYLSQAGTQNRISTIQHLSQEDLILEFMMNTLRLTEGIESALFEQRTGLPLEYIDKPLQQAIDKELLTFSNDKIQPTVLGSRYLNDLTALFMS